MFGYSYDEIAGFLNKTAAACRQVAVRARRLVAEDRPRFDTSRQERDEFARRFVTACQEGELEGMLALLAPDASFTGDGDGGGKGLALREPAFGADKVVQLLQIAFAKINELGLWPEHVHVGGHPGLRIRDAENRTFAVWSLLIADGVLVAVHGVTNPDKLAHLQKAGSDVGGRG